MLSILTPILSNLLLWIFLALAAVLWALTRGRRRRRLAAAALLALLWGLSARPVAELALWPLESRYPRPEVAELRRLGVEQVVVLTGGGLPVAGELLATAFPDASAHRLLAGLELCARLGPDCRLVFSGSAGRGRRQIETARAMRELARLLDPGREAVFETLSGSTAEHPANVRPLLAPGPFALVTSAYHLPRATRSFRRAGLEPIAYPADPHVMGGAGWLDWLPSVAGLRISQLALREYLAWVLYTARGW